MSFARLAVCGRFTADSPLTEVVGESNAGHPIGTFRCGHCDPFAILIEGDFELFVLCRGRDWQLDLDLLFKGLICCDKFVNRTE